MIGNGAIVTSIDEKGASTGEIQWANVSTTLTKKPVTCARNTKSTSVSPVSVAVIQVGTASTGPRVS